MRDGSWIAGLHQYDNPARIFQLEDCPITDERVVATWRDVFSHSEFFPESRDLRGSVRITVDGPGKKDSIAVHAFVMVPARTVRDGMLNGYRIGEYPAARLKGSPLYAPPPGFVEVTRDNESTYVSPHFQLKQFICK